MPVTPIPARILTHHVVFRVPSADGWGEAAWQEYAVHKVALQPSRTILIGKDKKERQCKATLFYDCKLSSGADDLRQWLDEAEAQNKELEVIALSTTYHVIGIDWLYDDKGEPHHWEILLC